jgi:hypothetical protein
MLSDFHRMWALLAHGCVFWHTLSPHGLVFGDTHAHLVAPSDTPQSPPLQATHLILHPSYKTVLSSRPQTGFEIKKV